MDGIANSNDVNNTTERQVGKVAFKSKLKIHIKAKNKGKLHEELGVKEGQKIPASKEEVKSTDSPLLKKRKQFALNALKFKK